MASTTRREWIGSAAALAAGALHATACRRGNAAGSATSRTVELDVRWIEQTIGKTPVRLRSYNGTVPGPTLETRPGDMLRVRLRNSLPHNQSKGWNGDHNVPHDFSTTNLHLHGLDIAPHLFEPQGTSNPLARMLRIDPGRSYDYAFRIPDDHPPGLYWYHPHHHGSTAVQAVSGMAGALIVRGDIDEVPEIKAAREIVLAMQDIGLFPSDDVPGVWEYNPRQNAIWQTFKGYVTIDGKPTDLKGGFTTGDYQLRYFLVNGQPFFQETHNTDPNKPQSPIGQQLTPARIEVAPGEVIRIRMLNGCSDNLMPIVVENHEMHLIALDGVNFPAPRVIPPQPIATGPGQVLLAPANRAEFLIKANATPGTIHRIVQLAQAQQFLESQQKVIAELHVTSAPVRQMGLPTTLPTPPRYYPLIQPSDVQAHRTLVFGGVFPGIANPVVGIDFLINNSQYQETAVPQVVALNRVEEWQLQVFGAHHGGTEGHPFHIHVNHFEVISIDGQALPPGTIRDTVWVPMKSTVVVRMRFKQFRGKSVYHCHILPHEDTGMMQNFLIS